MRVTSNLFPETFKTQTQYLQTRQLDLQRQVATGLRIEKSSDDPVAFQFAQVASQSSAAAKAYLTANAEATSTAEYNYQGMSDLYRLVTRAQELGARATNAYGKSDLSAMGAEMSGILDQIAGIANRQKADGSYLFGGTNNIAPVLKNGTVTVTSPLGGTLTLDNYDYNSSANYTNTVTKVDIAKNVSVQTGIIAGASNTNGGASSFSGFLSDGTGLDAGDLLATVQSMRDKLYAGTPLTDQPEWDSIRTQSNRISEFVGRTAAQIAAFDTNKAALQEQMRFNTQRIGDATDVSLTDAISELNKVQLHYQGALQSGSRILQTSLLDFLR